MIQMDFSTAFIKYNIIKNTFFCLKGFNYHRAYEDETNYYGNCWLWSLTKKKVKKMLIGVSKSLEQCPQMSGFVHMQHVYCHRGEKKPEHIHI